MKKIVAALMIVVLLFAITVPKQEAHADALALSALAGASYAIASSNGLNWIFSGMSAVQTGTYMEQKLNSYASSKGSSVLEYFGENAVLKIATGIAVTAFAYNKICQFFEDLITEKNITAGNTVTIDNLYNGFSTGELRASVSWDGKTVDNLRMVQRDGYQELYYDFTDTNGTKSAKSFANAWNAGFYGFKVYTYNNTLYCKVYYWVQYSENGAKNELNTGVGYMGGASITSHQTASATLTGTFDPETAIGTERWEGTGTFNGGTLAETINNIYTDVASGDLEVAGYVGEEAPATPQPTDVPSDIIGGIEGVQEGIDIIIGNQEDVLEGIDTLQGTQTGILEGVTDIAGALEGVEEGVGTITETLEGIDTDIGSISEALEIPTTSQATQLKLPDLRTLFPFCIPFDIYNIITAFNASPVAPHVQIPFNIPAIGLTYTFDLDFSSYNSVAAVLRTVEFVAYAIGLAILSSKVIRW